ncbi:MAG: hypothetical protein AAB316_03220, partial [Bacteroidota bacterium]
EITFKYLKDTFSELHEKLEEMLEEQGLDIEDVIKEAESIPEPEPTQKQQELLSLANHYATALNDWTKKSQTYFQPEEIMSALMTHPGNMEQVADDAMDAFDTLQWFMFFMEAKLHRAISGYQTRWDDDEDSVQNDWNGSAKIALIATQECMAAWETLQNIFPELEDSILDNLAILDRLKRGILAEFPQAMEFVRPGFDEPEYDEVKERG